MDFWNHRLFLLEGDAKYIDVMERTLFNGLLSGVSLDGKTFFYPNPLESNGQHARQEWFGVACCPGNITRFMPSVPGYLYATRGDAIFVNLFARGNATIDLPGGPVWHFDLYRLEHPGEARELGLEEAVDGLALIEWPERLGRDLPIARLEVRLSFDGAGRIARLVDLDDWSTRLNGDWRPNG